MTVSSAAQATRREPAEPLEAKRFDASLSCFLNAVLHETDLGRLQRHDGSATFAVDLGDGHRLWVPVTHRARTVRHGLGAPCRIEGPNGSAREASFPEVAERVLDAVADDAEDARPVLERVLRSDRNLRDAVAARRGELDHLFGDPLTFAEAEGALLVGHAMHPCPKDRTRFSAADARCYAPEHAARFPLQWVAVDPEHVAHAAAGDARHRSLVADVAEADPQVARWRRETGDAWLVPCHPYQLEHWRSHPTLARRLAEGTMRVLGPGELDWRATTSLRTVYSEAAPWMPKFSLTVKLTNSLRHLHPDELARGPQVAELLDGPEGRRWLDRFPRFSVLQEPVSLALVDREGAPIDATGVTWRENPYRGDAADGAEVLATLLQDDPRDGVPRLVKRLRATGQADPEGARRWLEGFLDVAVEPLLAAHVDHGLLFGAHQQNLVLDLDGATPTHATLRDCQGAAFTPLARETFGPVVDDLVERGALAFEQDTANVLLGYYVIVNTTFNAVSSLARLDGVRERALVDRVRGLLEDLRAEDPADPSLLDYLLEAPQLEMKGNFHYALTGTNETTQDADLLDFYRPIPNPLREDA